MKDSILHFIIRVLVNGVVIFVMAMYLPGISATSLGWALLFALILALINAVIKPLIMVLTFPINLLTIGLFTLVINALLFWLASAFIVNVYVDGFWWAFLGALIISAVSWLLSGFLKKDQAQE